LVAWLVACGFVQVTASADDTALAAPVAADESRLDPTGKIRGLWVWKRESFQDPEARKSLIDFCREHRFNRLLVQVHAARNSRQRGEPTLALPGALAALLKDAAVAGIAVEALDGAKDMALRRNWDATLAMLDAILAFNRAQPDGERFIAMHYDIEPYIMAEWKTDARDSIMKDYLGYLALARRKLDADAPGMMLAADIPMWYDRKTEPGDTCVVEFNGVTKNLHEHVQDLTDYVGIMSYRRHATGENSVIEHVEAELFYAEKIGKTICAALETTELKDAPQISFFGQGPEKLWETRRKIEETLAAREGFGGTFIHNYDGLRALLEQKTADAADAE
jgi:hypothetical protein